MAMDHRAQFSRTTESVGNPGRKEPERPTGSTSPPRDAAGRALDEAGVPDSPAMRELVRTLVEAGHPASPAIVRRLVNVWQDLAPAARPAALALAVRGFLPSPALLALGGLTSPPPSSADRTRRWMASHGDTGQALLAGEGDLVTLLASWVRRLVPREALWGRHLATGEPAASNPFTETEEQDTGLPLEEAWPQGAARLLNPWAPVTLPLAWGPWTGRWTHWEREARQPDEGGAMPGPWRTMLTLEHPERGVIRIVLTGSAQHLDVRLEASDPVIREALAGLVAEAAEHVGRLGWQTGPWLIVPLDEESPDAP